MNLSGKNILVTGGGGTGVGYGICKVLASLEATLVLNELKPEYAKRAVINYPGAIPVAADISKSNEVTAMFRNIEQKVGILHGLVNNAGIGLSKLAHNVEETEFDNLYDVDLKGVWQVSKAFVNQLLGSGQTGNIVNISSVHTHSTIPGYAIYASAKSAVEGLTRGMAVELGPHNIRVNAVAPGYVHSEQNHGLIKTWADDPETWVKNYIVNQQALHREIEPEDCGNVVAFLMSDLSRSVTGQTVYVDNGSTILINNHVF